jgi:hypothetical protein
VRFHERRAERILETLDGQPRTLWELTQILFPRVNRGMDYFLALSEVLGHLDMLEDSRRAVPMAEAGVVRWQRV